MNMLRQVIILKNRHFKIFKTQDSCHKVLYTLYADNVNISKVFTKVGKIPLEWANKKARTYGVYGVSILSGQKH